MMSSTFKLNRAIVLFFAIFSTTVFSQEIPFSKVLNIDELADYLKEESKKEIDGKKIAEASLAGYFREKFAERYFYDWKTVENRFKNYNYQYPNNPLRHKNRADDHQSKYTANTLWKLPFNYQNGSPVNAYALRHLARQHKMIDIAYQYFYENKDPKFIKYFEDQLVSLNSAFEKGEFEKIEDGNGVYEAFRSGYRVLNWLHIHNLFLGEKEYSDKDQLTTISTLLQHGAHLYHTNQEFKSGNHQTRGLSALAMISILFRDFKGTDKWYNHAMDLLEEHMRREINNDGFQFERTVHYHMSDIGNYYYVYQLAKISEIPVKPFWEERLKSLFISLTKIAYPDKSAPVLSDDTDEPWAEKNDISGALTLGYLLFNNPEYGYFANDFVTSRMFWYTTDEQMKMLSDIQAKKPTIGSTEFTDTGYYIMREGWEEKDKMMIISAGLDDKKPDHQHGDMLGVQAIANNKIILPNYQVRYSLKDLELFKNSMTKNVALVDEELQGKKYVSNKGGSGFGKFKNLPNPKVLSWYKGNDIEVFIGQHDGFENVGVSYLRKVINVANEFWIVKDEFKGNSSHNYKQVWQGHYSEEEGANLLRASFDNGSGFDIYQLNKVDEVNSDGRRGKHWSVVSKNNTSSFDFITALYPYDRYSKRINELAENKTIGSWGLSSSDWKVEGENSSVISNESEAVLFSVKKVTYKDFEFEFDNSSDVYLSVEKNGVKIISLEENDSLIQIKKGKVKDKIELIKGREIMVSLF